MSAGCVCEAGHASVSLHLLNSQSGGNALHQGLRAWAGGYVEAAAIQVEVRGALTTRSM